MTARPAILGGPRAFPDGVPFALPFTPPLARVMARVAPSYDAGVLTNGPLVQELEERVATLVGVDHAVAVSSCTAGLILALRAMADGDRASVVPSFTFAASAHAVAWNGIDPVFAECDPASFSLDVADAGRRLRATQAGTVMATHVFGAPCAAEELEALAAGLGTGLVFDAAHALGATRRGNAVGAFGDAEVFSLSPTKVVTAGEGGIVTTSNEEIAEAVRVGRDYGNAGDYDARFVGLSARLSELHAAMALESLDLLDEHLARRRALADRYRAGLAPIPGVTPQVVAPGDESTYSMFTVAIDAEELGLDRDRLAEALAAEGVDTRAYFFPPVHRQRAYAALPSVDLPVTDDVSARVLSLPMYGALTPTTVDGVVAAVGAIHERAEELGNGRV